MQKNPIIPTISLDQDGKHHGFLKLPHSRDDSAWGSVMIPITVVKNGEGPTALLTGANHGDEYEGPIALQDMALTLEPHEVAGRVIIVPFLNYPAFRNGTRTSPIDGGNMNRVFPGRPDGTVTEKIADYFQRTLVPMTDIVLDFHSGGKTLDFLPFAASHVLADKEQEARCRAAVLAFNAPYSVQLLEIDNTGMYDTAVEDQRKTLVSTELGGGGTSTPQTIAIAKRGVRNVLAHAGILDDEIIMEPTIDLEMPDEDCFLFAERDGLIEPLVGLGETIRVGDPIAQLWPADRTGEKPTVYSAKINGLLISRHFPGLIQAGDCLAVTAVPVKQ